MANGSQLTDQTIDEPNESQTNTNQSNSSNNSCSHDQQNGGSNPNGIAFNGVNDDMNGSAHDLNSANSNNSNSDNKFINIKSRTDQDIIRLIGQHLRVLGLKYGLSYDITYVSYFSM